MEKNTKYIIGILQPNILKKVFAVLIVAAMLFAAMPLDAAYADGNTVTLSYGSDIDILFSEYMLKGDVNGDKVVDNNDKIVIEDHINGSATLTGLAFESGDINGDGNITSDDAVLLDKLLNGQISLPDNNFTFRVSDVPDVVNNHVDTVSVNGNEFAVPDGYSKSEDTTVGGVTYTVTIDKYGVTTVSGQCLDENDVRFNCKSINYNDYYGRIRGDVPTYVYDGLAHEPGDIHLMRFNDEVTGIDQIVFVYTRIGQRKINYYQPFTGSSQVVYTDDSVVMATPLTPTNWDELAQNTLDYITTWNEGDKPEFKEAGDYEFDGYPIKGTQDPSGPLGGAAVVGMVPRFNILIITKRSITITASTNSDLTDYTIGGDGLAANQTIQSITTATSTTGDTVTSTVSDAVIIDAQGNDVTKNYNITYIPSSYKVYTIVYDGNGNDGGIVPTDSNVYAIGDTVTIPTGAPTKTGYTFKGWEVNLEYQPGETFIFGAMHAGNADENNVVTLSAQWTLNTPQTGDNSNIWLFAGLMFLSLIVMVILLIISKRK